MTLRLIALIALCGCASSSGAAANALINTAIAASVGAANVAQGECFTVCPTGTACNLKTQTCDDLPCHDRCRPDELCDQSGLFEHCAQRANGVPLRVDEVPK